MPRVELDRALAALEAALEAALLPALEAALLPALEAALLVAAFSAFSAFSEVEAVAAGAAGAALALRLAQPWLFVARWSPKRKRKKRKLTRPAEDVHEGEKAKRD